MKQALSNPFFRIFKKVPAGPFIIPLLTAAIINTVLTAFNANQGISNITATATTIIFAIVMLSAGMQIQLKSAPVLLGRSAVLLVAKFIAGFGIGLLVAKIFGGAGFLGVSSLAFICAITNSNGGIYLNLVNEYGNADDVMAYSLLAFNDGPYLTMIAMSAAGLAVIPFTSILITFSPMLLGIIIGNIFPAVFKYARITLGIALVFFAVVLGFGINLFNVVVAGIGGIVLGLTAVIGSGIILVLADRYINRRPGYAGAAVASVAGNAVATPALIAAVDPSWLPFVEKSTAAISAAVVVCVILTPLFTHFVAKKYGCPKYDLTNSKIDIQEVHHEIAQGK